MFESGETYLISLMPVKFADRMLECSREMDWMEQTEWRQPQGAYSQTPYMSVRLVNATRTATAETTYIVVAMGRTSTVQRVISYRRL